MDSTTEHRGHRLQPWETLRYYSTAPGQREPGKWSARESVPGRADESGGHGLSGGRLTSMRCLHTPCDVSHTVHCAVLCGATGTRFAPCRRRETIQREG